MHPDDEREYMDEISGFTRWDDMNERYGESAKDYPEYEDEQEELRQQYEDGPNYVYAQEQDDGWITDQWEEDHEVPF